MHKFLYLTELSWADPWTTGGSLPLFVASTYRKNERSGIYTPDEVQQINYTSDPRGFFDIDGGMTVRNATIFDSANSPGRTLSGSQWHEDGLVLSLSSAPPTWALMQRFRKQCCVRIEDVESLKTLLDSQIGAVSEMRDCEYTWDWNRTHFLKGELDKWQAEFRLFWKAQPSQSVTLPAGIASTVPLQPPPAARIPRLSHCYCMSGKRFKDCHGTLV